MIRDSIKMPQKIQGKLPDMGVQINMLKLYTRVYQKNSGLTLLAAITVEVVPSCM
jgi:hypothetical protein